MTISLIVTLVVMLSLTLFVLGITWTRKKRITCMTGMMIAMVVGMITGLLGGVIFGVLFNGNLFLSTVVSMTFGMLVGFLAGLPISVMSVMDGMLSGLMGGMMGAMLGEMIPNQYWDAMIKIMFVLFVALMITLFYFIQGETIRKGEEHTMEFIRNPLILMLFFLVFFYFYTKLGPSVVYMKNDSHFHSSELINNIILLY